MPSLHVRLPAALFFVLVSLVLLLELWNFFSFEPITEQQIGGRTEAEESWPEPQPMGSRQLAYLPRPIAKNASSNHRPSRATKDPRPIQTGDQCRHLPYSDAHGLFLNDTPRPRIVVTGGAGFLGSRLVMGLRANGIGPDQIKVLDDLSSGELRNLRYPSEHLKGSQYDTPNPRSNAGQFAINTAKHFCLVDLRSPPLASKYIYGADVVYNLAGLSSTSTCPADTSPPSSSSFHKLARFNDAVRLTWNVLIACQEGGVRDLIHVSPLCVADLPQDLSSALSSPSIPTRSQSRTLRGKDTWDFQTTLRAASVRCLGLAVGEIEARLAMEPHVLNVGLVRLATVYGPPSEPLPESEWGPGPQTQAGSESEEESAGEDALPDPNDVVGWMVRRAVRSRLGGHGGQGRSWSRGRRPDLGLDIVHVDDAVRALLLVKERGMNSGVMEIGSGVSVGTANEGLGELVGRVLDDLWQRWGGQGAVRYSGAGEELRKIASSPSRTVTKPDLESESESEGLCEDGGFARPAGRPADVRMATSRLGWRPNTTLQQGVEALARDHLNLHLKARASLQLKVPRVLVVLIGQARGGVLAWKSLHRHLLRPYKADLATYLAGRSPANDYMESMAQYVWRVPAYKDWSMVFNAAARRCGFTKTEDVRRWTILCHQSTMWLGGLAQCPQQQASAGILMSLRWLALNRIRELGLESKYDYMILTRGDELYLCDHAPFQVFATAKDNIWVHYGEEYQGWSDRHILGRTDVFVRAINLTQELVCEPETWYRYFVSKMQMQNIEMTHKYMWQRLGIPVRQYARSQFTVKTPEDTTMWSLGERRSVTDAFGLLTKYPGELDAAMGYCGLDTAQAIERIRSLESYDPGKN